MRFSDRLESLEITLADFETYWETFVKGNHRYWIKKSTLDYWHMVNNSSGEPVPLDYYKVIRHLAGHYWVAKRPAGVTDLFTIDVDAHSYRNVRDRFDAVTRVIGNGLPIRSSDSGGIHVYWFLRRRTITNELKTLLEEVMSAGGLEPRSGFLEPVPGTLTDHLRLPLGKGSAILDPETLEPLGLSLQESIGFIMYHRKDFSVDLCKRREYLLGRGRRIRLWNKNVLSSSKPLVSWGPNDFPNLCDEANTLLPDVTNPYHHHDDSTSAALDVLLSSLQSDHPQADGTSPESEESNSRFLEGNQSVRTSGRIVSSPIRQYGSRNEMILKAIQEQMITRGKTAEETEKIILDWLRRADLEHRSNDLELRPQAVEQQVKAAVKNFETKLRIHPCWSACAPLSLGDVKAIAELTSETKHERKLGRVDFYNQLFAFHLLGLFKARGSADLPLPFSKLWKIPGASAHTAKDRMFFCLNKGLVKLARPEQPDRNLCRIYHLVYEFREGTRVNSLQEGLQALYDPTVLFRMYSRGIYNRITRC